jgi:DNA-binding FadR family transcriptional regulator
MAAAVAGFAPLDATTARGAIRSLASKSLLALEQRGGVVVYKFPDTTRTYAAGKARNERRNDADDATSRRSLRRAF